MSTIDDKKKNLINEVVELRNTLAEYGKPEIVTLFAEDYDFLNKQGAIEDGRIYHYIYGFISVKRGDRKRKQRRRRPKETLFSE